LLACHLRLREGGSSSQLRGARSRRRRRRLNVLALADQFLELCLHTGCSVRADRSCARVRFGSSARLAGAQGMAARLVAVDEELLDKQVALDSITL
jgi:hypothetical protein